MSRLLFYVIIKPLSHLPLPVLYVISNAIYFALYYVFGYRKAVVRTNLSNSFPDKSKQEHQAIAKKFYRYLSDFIVEGIKLFSISTAEVLARCQYKNTEIFEPYFRSGKSVIVVACHYSCWELLLQTLSLHIPHQGVTIYKPLSDSFFDHQFKKMRGKFGQQLWPMEQTREFMATHQQLIAPIFGVDQSPTFNKKVHWTRFLNQETPVAYGVEYFAKKYDLPVVFATLHPLERGYFEVDFSLIHDSPGQSKAGEITEKHVRALEKMIRLRPQYWLWSHRRWKRCKTSNDDPPQDRARRLTEAG